MQQLKKIFFNKRVLLILCFLAINIIELLRSGPTGDVWYVANNCTGIAMMFIVFSGYKIKNFLTVTNYIWTAVCVAFMIFLPFHWRNHIGEYLLWQVETAVFNIWWIFIIVKHQFCCVFVKKTLKVKFNALSIVWIAMMLFMVISVNEYKVWPLWFLLMFGAFYLTQYSDEDRELLWSSMVDGNIIGFFILQIYAYGLRPFDTLRYSGYASNCNVAAQYYMVIYIMCLCKLHQLEMKKAKVGTKIFYLLGAGGMLSFQFLTMGRTSWVMSVVITILYGILVIKKLWNKKWKQVFARGFIIVAFMVITFLPVFYTCRWLPTLSPGRVWYEAEYHNDDLVHSWDPATSEKYTDLDEFLDAVFGRIIHTLKMIQVKDPFAMTVYATDGRERVELLEPEWLTDPGTRIRLTIYKTYLTNLKWSGHPQADGFYQIGDLDYVSWHGHNVWIHIAYNYGIPVGILLVALTFLLFADGFKKIYQFKEKWYSIVPFFICVGFFGYGIMEAVWYVGHILMFLIFFVQLPIVSEENTKSEGN